MSSSNNYEQLAKDLLVRINKDKDRLFALSRGATGNSSEDTYSDYEASMKYLEAFRCANIPTMRKPKGKICIILSINEPLLLSIVPIVSALVMGNDVIVRPSSKNIQLFNLIWKEVIEKHELNLRVVADPLETSIQQVAAVYFFGSHHTARKIYQLCADNFVEFIPEIEAADTQIFRADIKGWTDTEMSQALDATLASAFNHDGKICQRITGVYVYKELYSKYIEYLTHHLLTHEYSRFDVGTQPKDTNEFMNDVRLANPEFIYEKDGSVVAINPDVHSPYANSAYFEKSLWIICYENTRQLLDMLAARPYRMGLNIISDNQAFTEQIIQETNFSRYTIGGDHCNILQDTGWGGNWPTGSGGYRDWYTAFSNSFAVIVNK